MPKIRLLPGWSGTGDMEDETPFVLIPKGGGEDDAAICFPQSQEFRGCNIGTGQKR